MSTIKNPCVIRKMDQKCVFNWQNFAPSIGISEAKAMLVSF